MQGVGLRLAKAGTKSGRRASKQTAAGSPRLVNLRQQPFYRRVENAFGAGIAERVINLVPARRELRARWNIPWPVVAVGRGGERPFRMQSLGTQLIFHEGLGRQVEQ